LAEEILRWRLCKYAFVFALGIAFAFALESVSFAQRTTSTSSKRGFMITGDVRVDDSQAADEQKPAMLDVILYTKGDQVYARQRIAPNGRYRFMDVFDGDYYIAIEVENKEIARVSVFISTTSPMELKQDINLEWRSTAARNGGAVVSAADLYNRSGPNKSLYEKSAKEIESKDYTQAVTTLRSLVASDPNDFRAWSDLGMVYFVIQKDYEAAENCYVKALAAKPTYFPAVLNLGRVRLARKNYEGAIEPLEAALRIDPKSASANYFLGEAYLQLKKGSKAVGYLNEALKLDPVGMAEAHLRLAALYNGAGMKDKAAAEYEQFLKKKPTYADRPKLEKYIADNQKP
jgi:tetratricopeptide (TPR) repeat protein